MNAVVTVTETDVPVVTNGGGEGTPPKILIAEDNIAEARRLGLLLSTSGFECEIEYAHTLDKAVSVCERTCPQIVLLDLGLPGCEGSEALEAVRAVCPRVAVVIVTGSDDDDLMLKTGQLGARSYIRKERLNVHRLLFAIYAAKKAHEEAEKRQHQALAFANVMNQLTRIEDTLKQLQRTYGHEGQEAP